MLTANHRTAIQPKNALTSVLLVCVCIVTSGGCRLCCDREDAAFAAYGGAWKRLHRDSGRVGSLADPGGAKVGDLEDKMINLGETSSRSQVIPPNHSGRPDSQEAPEDLPESFTPRDEETEEEFQERMKRFQEEQLNAKVYPGSPTPPSFR
ncbi:hypothetical protein [Rhodopirellula sp. MGV]|uniref:hypothetical protein n=1 Tax=Rhodopirellula sp. MGV TaxID=2023130 RepID=UPI00117B88B0|nr:hypothetical protein [Rhodopirellula sp. MGV]